MKKILMNIGIGYLCIGGFMGTITGISYAYAQAFVLFSMGWGMFSLSGLSFLMLSGYFGEPGAVYPSSGKHSGSQKK